MELNFSERPYAGKNFRPRPEILIDREARLLIVATPWGARSSARKVIERMTEYLTLTREDREATSPFDRLSCLSSQANHLRIAALLANELVHREDNRLEYRSGVELFATVVDEKELVWVQAGNPQILLSREGSSLSPLGSQIDLAFDFSRGNEILPPLPSQLLGLDSSLNLNLNSFRAQAGDRLILLSHSHPPQKFYEAIGDQVGLDPMSRQLATHQPDLAFWLGILDLQSTEESR